MKQSPAGKYACRLTFIYVNVCVNKEIGKSDFLIQANGNFCVYFP